MRVVFMGTPDFSVSALAALIEAGHEIAAVYTQPPRRAGRGKKEQPSPVHKFAEQQGFAVRHPINFKDAKDIKAFEDLNADVAVVVAYGLLLPQSILEAPKLGCLNIHASLLPRWRGAAPIHRAIMAGDKETGVGIMQMEAGLDTGPVLLEKRIDIVPEDTTGSLHNKLKALGADAIVETLEKLSELKPIPQSEENVTYAKKVVKAEALINWNKPAIEVKNHIHGLSPFPGAWCEINGERLKILEVEIDEKSGEPGTIIGDPMVVACGNGAVSVKKAQRASKGPMEIDALLNGFDVGIGTKLS